MRTGTRIGQAAAIAAALLWMIPSANAQSAASVHVRDNEFVPQSVEIDAGDKVTWTQTGTAAHSVTADDDSFDSHPGCPSDCMEQGDTYERTFNSPGTIRYYCKIHGGKNGTGMAGTVVVRGAENDENDEDEDEEAPTTTQKDGLPRSGVPVAPGVASLLLIGSFTIARIVRRR